MKKIILLCFTLISITATAQVKVGSNPTTLNANAVLEVESTDKGFLPPRLALSATTNAAPLSAHVVGMLVYNTATAGDVTPGLYYNDGTKWGKIDKSASSGSNQIIHGSPINTQCLGSIPNGTSTAASAPASLSYGGFVYQKVITATHTDNGHSYAAYVNQSGTAVNWFTAKDAAAYLGGYLATFTGREEWLSFHAVLDVTASLNTRFLWMGMARYGYGNGWFQDNIGWITCEEPDRYYAQGSNSRVALYHNFSNNQPDNSGGIEGFIHTSGKGPVGAATPFGAGTSHAWNDVQAGQGGVTGFIVEFQQ